MTLKLKWPLLTLLSIGLLAAAFTIYRFGQSTPNLDHPRQTVIHLGTFSTAIDYSPFYVAKRQGWLDEIERKHNVIFDYQDFESLPAINDALASKRLDIILEADTPAIIQQSSGNDLVAIAPLSALSEDVVLPISSAATTLLDLKGKRIAALLGTGFHYGLVSSFSRLGVSPNEYTVVNIAPAEAGAALAGGTVDAWAV